MDRGDRESRPDTPCRPAGSVPDWNRPRHAAPMAPREDAISSADRFILTDAVASSSC